jgi:hypothetical protein
LSVLRMIEFAQRIHQTLGSILRKKTSKLTIIGNSDRRQQ